MLRLMTRGALSSALMAPKLDFLEEEVESFGREDLGLVERGLRPWKETLQGESWWVWEEEKEGVNKVAEAAEAAMMMFSGRRMEECWKAMN